MRKFLITVVQYSLSKPPLNGQLICDTQQVQSNMQLNLSLIQGINRLLKSEFDALTQPVVATIFNLKPNATKHEITTF